MEKNITYQLSIILCLVNFFFQFSFWTLKSLIRSGLVFGSNFLFLDKTSNKILKKRTYTLNIKINQPQVHIGFVDNYLSFLCIILLGYKKCAEIFEIEL